MIARRTRADNEPSTVDFEIIAYLLFKPETRWAGVCRERISTSNPRCAATHASSAFHPVPAGHVEHQRRAAVAVLDAVGDHAGQLGPDLMEEQREGRRELVRSVIGELHPAGVRATLRTAGEPAQVVVA